MNFLANSNFPRTSTPRGFAVGKILYTIHFVTKNQKEIGKKRKKKFLGFELCSVEVKISRYSQAHIRLERQLSQGGFSD